MLNMYYVHIAYIGLRKAYW